MSTEMTPREMIMQRLKAEAEHFFEWDTDKRDYVTYTSCILFAEHIAEQQTAALRARIAELEMMVKRGDNGKIRYALMAALETWPPVPELRAPVWVQLAREAIASKPAPMVPEAVLPDPYNCRECAHPTICEQEGCSIELAQRYTAHLERREKTIEMAKSLGLTDEDLKVMGVKL